MTPGDFLRVLVIDDDPFFGRGLAAGLSACADMHAAACAGETAQVREQLLRHHPDVIVLDLGRRMSGALVMLRMLLLNYPVPVIVRAEPGAECTDRAAQAVALGAVDVLRIGRDGRPAAVRAAAGQLAVRIRAVAAGVGAGARLAAGAGGAGSFRARGVDPNRHVVAIGASTGGTEALAAVLARLPVDSPPVVIVQHMPAAFTGPFAARLDGLSAVRVTEAADGERLRAGCALLARGDTHLIVRRAGSGWVARYTHQEPVNRHCPSVDVLFDAVAAAAGVQAVGILLTGMGADGARGLLRLRQAGAVTIAQNENSCVVYGMPKQAVALGAAQYTAAPEEIPGLVLCALRARGHGCEKAVARHE